MDDTALTGRRLDTGRKLTVGGPGAMSSSNDREDNCGLQEHPLPLPCVTQLTL